MDLYLENIESDLNKSTNVNTDQGSNSKYPSVKAVFDWATNLFFPKPTGTTSEYLRGDGSVATFPTIPSIAGLVPETRTINGLDLSANRTLTTAEINDSTDKRYVTDAQLTVIGNTSGTNTGDETQSSILTKLGWFHIVDQTAGTSSSGTVNTISKSIELPSVPNKLKFRVVGFRNSGTTNTFTINAYLSAVDNNIGGTAIRIATVTGANSAVSFLPLKRESDIVSGNIIGLTNSGSQATDDVNISSARMNLAIPSGSPLYLIFAIQCANASDTARIESVEISNF